MDQEPIPDYLVSSKRSSIGNITVEDLIWVGLKGEIESDAILKRHGYDPDGPFTTILSAIIKGNPVDGRDAAERLETALDALIGIRRKPGMDELDADYQLLIQIAHKFFQCFHRDNHTEPELADIIREVIAPLPKDDPRIRATEDSVIRRLRRKFNANKNVLLVRATSEQDLQKLDARRSIATILRELRALGISGA